MSTLPNVQQQDTSPSSESAFDIDSWVRKRLKELEKSYGIHTKCIITCLPANYRLEMENILHSRWDQELDSLLEAEKRACPLYGELSQAVKTPAQELIAHLLWDRDSRIWDWTWKPLNPSLRTFNEVAENAHHTAFIACSKLRLGEVIRYVAFGDEGGAIKELFRGASAVSSSLRQQYSELNQAKTFYMSVAKVYDSILGSERG